MHKYTKIVLTSFLIGIVGCGIQSTMFTKADTNNHTSVGYNAVVPAKKQYTVTFICDKGGKLSGQLSIKVKEGEKVKSLPSVIPDSNHSFSGWYTNKKVDPKTVPIKSNTTFRAKFNEKPATKVSAMYRLYNPNSGEHFYTAKVPERDSLKKVGWKYENIGWYAPIKGSPVYRLYNPNAGDHHYTTNLAEKNNLVKVGWRYEGVGWYSGGSTSVYREYNPNAKAGAHNFTTSKFENDSLGKSGWRKEGTAWYAEQGKLNVTNKSTKHETFWDNILKTLDF